MDTRDPYTYIYALASFLINTLLLSTIPTTIALCYLWSWKFFSYDFLQDGFFALSLSTFFCFVAFLMISLPFLGGWSIFLTSVSNKLLTKTQVNQKTWLISYFMLGISIYLSISLYINVELPIQLRDARNLLCVVMLLVFSYFGFIFSKITPVEKAKILVSVIIMTNLVVLFNPMSTSQLLSYGFRQFALGGGTPMEFRERGSSELKQGWKILETPTRVYFVDSNYQQAIAAVDLNVMYDYRTYPDLNASFDKMMRFTKDTIADVE